MLRILNLEPAGYSSEARAILTGLGELVEASLSRRELLAALPEYDVLITRLQQDIDKEVIDAGRQLRAIVSATTGLDHIDVAHARSRGIAVLSLQGERALLEGISSTAEHTWALLLALVRRIPAAFASVRDGRWDRDAFRGRTLAGRRLRLVGLGRTGRMVARYGKAFGLSVVAHDPDTGDWPADIERRDSLAELLADADVLSLHLPLTAQTRSCIGAEELAWLPAGAMLINTSRGELLDEAALVQALESGRLAGAAVDVIAHERSPELRMSSPLLAYAHMRDNLIITPHLGGATVEAMAETEVFMARKLEKFLRGGS